ncbi:MAG: N-acetyl sugar amidotransferase [Methanomassiliicoccales archaeon]
MERPYQICTKCVMDTSDPEITFDENGVCNHCHRRDYLIERYVLKGDVGKRALDYWVKRIKSDGRKKPYDCIIGISGGVDSSYAAYLTHKLGLRPLAVHVDNGWNSELSVKNIELLLNKLNIDLYTEVLDWETFRDLQVAFLKASTPDSEIPTDHAIVAVLRKTAEKERIKYIIVGSNYMTETHVPRSWSYGTEDLMYIKSLNRLFGTHSLEKFPHYNLFMDWVYKYKFQRFPILNYIDYNKTRAISILNNEIGWKYYGGKHYESIYTRFYQGYILPKKFGYDKRRSHFSSLICSGEMSRENALIELQKPPYPLQQQLEDRQYVIKKLELSEEEFERIMSSPPKTHLDYPCYDRFFIKLRKNGAYKLLQQANRKLKIINQR